MPPDRSLADCGEQ